MNTNELGAIRECCFYLHLGNHFGNSIHDLIAAQYLAALRHQFGNGFAVPRSLQYEIAYECKTFWIVELHTSIEARSSNHCRNRDHQLVFFAWCEIHNIVVL